MRSPLLRLFAGLLLLSWLAALGHIAQAGCGGTAATAHAATHGDDADSDDDADGRCAHGAVDELAGGVFAGASFAKVLPAVGEAWVLTLLPLPTPAENEGRAGFPPDRLDSVSGPPGWLLGGKTAHPVRGPSRKP